MDTKVVLANLTQQLKLAAGTDLVFLVLLALAVLFTGARLWRAPTAGQRLVPWCWVLCLPLLYALRGISVTPQHLVMVAPVFAWLAWRAADVWWFGDGADDARKPARASVALFCSAIALGQSLIVYMRDVVPELREERRV